MPYLIPDIKLFRPNLLATATESSLGIFPRSKNTAVLMFGMVEKVYDGCGDFVVGNVILFPQAEATQIIYGSTIFYLVPEDKIIFSE